VRDRVAQLDRTVESTDHGVGTAAIRCLQRPTILGANVIAENPKPATYLAPVGCAPGRLRQPGTAQEHPAPLSARGRTVGAVFGGCSRPIAPTRGLELAVANLGATIHTGAAARYRRLMLRGGELDGCAVVNARLAA
jgi:hypothetical protein